MALKYKMEVDGRDTAKVKSFGKSIGDVDKRTKKLSSSFKTLVGAYAGIQGFRIGVSVAKDLVAAYTKQEAAEKRLAAAMKERNIFTEEAFEHQKKFAASLQQSSVFGDEEIMVLQRQLVQYGLYGSALDDATKASLDFASAKGVDIKVAGDLLGKTLASSTNAMSRYGIAVEGSVGSSERLESALGGINAMFGGSAQAEIETYTGKLAQLENKWGDLKEVLGEKLIPALTTLVDWIDTAIDSLFDLFNVRENEKIKDMQEEMNALVKEINGIDEAMKGATISTSQFSGSFVREARKAAAEAKIDKLKADILELQAAMAGPDKRARPGGIVATPGAGAAAADKDKSVAGENLRLAIIKAEAEAFNAKLAAQQESEAAEERLLAIQQKKLDGIAEEKQLRIDAADSAIGSALALTALFKDDSAEMFALAKGLAIAQATMNAYQAFTVAIATYPPPFGQIAGVASLALGLAQVTKIAGTTFQRKARGGIVDGPGGTDSIPTMLTRGEGVLTGDEMRAGGGLSRIRNMINNTTTNNRAIHIHGPIIGTREFVRDHLVPEMAKQAAKN